jgi:hypothetical protein
VVSAIPVHEQCFRRSLTFDVDGARITEGVPATRDVAPRLQHQHASYRHSRHDRSGIHAPATCAHFDAHLAGQQRDNRAIRVDACGTGRENAHGQRSHWRRKVPLIEAPYVQDERLANDRGSCVRE